MYLGCMTLERLQFKPVVKLVHSIPGLLILNHLNHLTLASKKPTTSARKYARNILVNLRFLVFKQERVSGHVTGK